MHTIQPQATVLRVPGGGGCISPPNPEGPRYKRFIRAGIVLSYYRDHVVQMC
ncbi:uncharacterized protein B0T23DRAFT_383216 [Neurospora hispaniola]|uniref:Uncharacterized protein n=1 Tax=Neurospora hispaniola TaxID=588809 RepID=A0AAJ0I6T5_9PEZI|nr:hypothetical protein B0T23DRAFT_383216 [Neurospora hispaniola]